MGVRWLPSLLVLLLACGDDSAAPTADAGTDAGTPDAGTPDVGAPDAGPTTLRVGPTDAELTRDFSVTIRATAANRFGEATVDDAFGSVTYRGERHDVVVYERQEWPEAGYTLYQGLMPRDEGWVVLWFYCQEERLTGIYSESTDGDVLFYEAAVGSCEGTDTPSTTRVTLEGATLPPPVLFEGTRITGATVEVGGAEPGWVELGGRRFGVHPFEHVDCTDCAMGGWRELHAMLADPGGEEICFAIFYLYLDDPDRVDLTYSLSLPSLFDPVGRTRMTATWTHTDP